MTSSNSAKQTRTPQSASVVPQHGSKLPRFLQKQTRDRSKSVNEPMQPSGSADSIIASSSSSILGSVAEGSSSPSATTKHRSDRRSSKLKGALKELKDDRIIQISQADHRDRDTGDDSMEETPVIVESVLPPSRSRARSDRPLSVSSSDSHPAVSYYPTSHSSQRLSDMGTRLSGWFSHTFSTSSTDLSLPAILSNAPQMSVSPKSKAGGLGLLTAARHGKGHLDKVVRYVLDSDATPDKCTDPIWLLGVQHPGYEPPPPPSPQTSPISSGRRSSLDMRRSSSFRNSLGSSRGATSSPEPSLSQSQQGKYPGAHWPPVFYVDFTSRVWLTYRSHFTPIRDQSLAQLEAEASSPPPPPQPVAVSPRKWNWPGAGERGWTSDAGWGCMLRTGQSLLANALIHLHLGRDWCRPPQALYTADYATYVKILTWFFDSPDPQCPFSVHRMALAGKDLGKDVGQWFGPSTAAGAIKTLVHAFSEAGLGVSVATDGVVYETDVLAASNVSPYMYRHSRAGTSSNSTRRRRSMQPQHMLSSIWGQRPVLVLIGIRLGIDGVNPIYYDSVKALYTFPQSVGIAGGRPSSSYYFVGAQADSLFYLDPHHARPAIPFRPPPRSSNHNGSTTTSPTDSPKVSHRDMQPSPSHVLSSPIPIHMQLSSSQSSYISRSSPSPSSHRGSVSGQSVTGGELDPVQEHYVTAYSPVELRTFHCDKVRKMPLSGLDPSMLIGFLCRDERDWRDLRERVSEMGRKYKAIFSIQDEPPAWPSDSDDMGLESVSDIDVDIDGPSDAFEDSPGLDEKVNIRDDVERSDSQGYIAGRGGSSGRQSEDVMTEEDPVGPMTPGPTTVNTGVYEHNQLTKADSEFKAMEDDFLDDDEEWVDPSLPTPQARDTPQFPFVPISTENSTATTASYVSASSTYSGMQRRNGGGSRSGSASREQGGDKGTEQTKHSEASRSSKVKPSKSNRSSMQRSDAPPVQVYYPFPVVDDREPDDLEFNDLSSASDSSRTGQSHQRQRTGTASSRTPIASVTLRNTNSGLGVGTGGSANGGGSRIRNTRGRDGGRTQSGGVRGIVTSELEDSSDF